MSGVGVATFATLSDLCDRTGRYYVDEERKRAETLLEDASVALVGLGFDPHETDEYRLHLARQCVCNAVANKLSRDASAEAVSQVTQQAGPYSQTVGFVAASGSLTFYKRDLALLGIGVAHYRGIGAATADLSRRDWGDTTC